MCNERKRTNGRYLPLLVLRLLRSSCFVVSRARPNKPHGFHVLHRARLCVCVCVCVTFCPFGRALEEKGAKEGDLIMIDDLDFDFVPEAKAHEGEIPQHLLQRDARMASSFRKMNRRDGSGDDAGGGLGGGGPGGGAFVGNMVGFEGYAEDEEFDYDDFEGAGDDEFDPQDFDASEWDDEEDAGGADEDASVEKFRRAAREAEEAADRASAGGSEKEKPQPSSPPVSPRVNKRLPFGVAAFEIDEDLLVDDDGGDLDLGSAYVGDAPPSQR